MEMNRVLLCCYRVLRRGGALFDGFKPPTMYGRPMSSSVDRSETDGGPGQSVDASADVGKNFLAEDELHSVMKVKQVSKAMATYLRNAEENKKLLNREIEQFELGKRHLANMMGVDADTMTQQDIDSFIEYLLPSGLFSPKARPVMKHPNEIFHRVKEAQFGMDGRPFHTLFYTVTPNFYQILYDCAENFERVCNYEDEQYRRGVLEPEDKLLLTDSDWLSKKELEELIIEPIRDEQYSEFLAAMNHLVEHPYAFRVKDFVHKYRKLIRSCDSQEEFKIPEVMYDLNGRAFASIQGRRKRAKADVKLFANGSGKVTIDGLELSDLFFQQSRETILAPFIILNRLGQFDVEAETTDGGEMSKAGAVRVGIARALCAFIPQTETERLRIAGLLTRDIRRSERKKPGQPKARKKWTWKKR